MSPPVDPTYSQDPPHTWVRKNFSLETPEGLTPVQRAERETDRDLDKSIQQLLCEFHEMAERITSGEMAERITSGGDLGSYPVQAMLHAQKRMVGMMAKVAISNNKVQRWLMILTIFMAITAGTQAVAAIVYLIKTFSTK